MEWARGVLSGLLILAVAGCLLPVSCGRFDPVPPEVDILTPLAGDSVAGSVEVRFVVTDDHELDLVELSFDSTLVRSYSEVACGDTFSWSYDLVAEGRDRWHDVRVDAHDGAGNTSYDGVRFYGIGKLPAMPIPKTPTVGDTLLDNAVEFTWTPALGAELYFIQVATDDGFVGLVVDDSAQVAVYSTGGHMPLGRRGREAGGSARTSGTLPVRYAPKPGPLPYSAGFGSPDSSDPASGFGGVGRHHSGLSPPGTGPPPADSGRVPTDGGGLDNGEYWWRVRARKAGGLKSDWAGPVRFVVGAVPAPIGLVAPADGSSDTTGQPEFSWQADRNAASYLLEVADQPGFERPLLSRWFDRTTTSHRPIVALPDADLYWRVTAENCYGRAGTRTEPWLVRIATELPDVPAPDEPEDGALVWTGEPCLSWHASTGADWYHVEIAEDPEFTRLVDGGTVEAPTTSYVPGLALTDTVEYFWHVAASNVKGRSGWQDPARRFRVITHIPPPPALIGPSGKTTDPRPVFRWRTVPWADQYVLELSDSPTFARVVLQDTVVAPETTFQAGQPIADGHWWWRVKAHNVYAWGTYGTSLIGFEIITTGPPPPELQAPENGATIRHVQPRFEWQATVGAALLPNRRMIPSRLVGLMASVRGRPSGKDGGDSLIRYWLQIARDTLFLQLVFSDSLDSTHYTPPPGLLAESSYYWRVRSRNGVGLWSGPTAPWQFSIEFARYDVGCIDIEAPVGTIDSGPAVPRAVVRNYGNEPVSFQVRLRTEDYTDTEPVEDLAVGSERTVVFASWHPERRGRFTMSCSTMLTGDATPGNDRSQDSVFVRVWDMTCLAIGCPGPVVDSGVPVVPTCSVYNSGNTTATCTVRMRIGGEYTSARLVTVEPGLGHETSFDTWVPRTVGSSWIDCATELAGDMYPENDTVYASVRVPQPVHFDAAVTAILQPQGDLPGGVMISPVALISNRGTAPVDVDARMFLSKPSGGRAYHDSLWVPDLEPGEARRCTFALSESLMVAGGWTARCSIYAADDLEPENDTMSNSFVVGELLDVAVTRLVAPGGVIDSTALVVPACSTVNCGNVPVDYWVLMQVGEDYLDSASVVAHAPGARRLVEFTESDNWSRGEHAVRCSTRLSGDVESGNDRQASTVTVRVLDVSAGTIDVPADTVVVGEQIVPEARVHNNGTGATSFPVALAIGADYADTSWVSSLEPGSTAVVRFDTWTPENSGRLTVDCVTGLSGDMDPTNDVRSRMTEAVREFDVGCTRILVPFGTLDSGTTEVPSCSVYNYCDRTVSYTVRFAIAGTPYVDTVGVADHQPSTAKVVEFGPWEAVEWGGHVVTCSTQLNGDKCMANDRQWGMVFLHRERLDDFAENTIADYTADVWPIGGTGGVEVWLEHRPAPDEDMLVHCAGGQVRVLMRRHEQPRIRTAEDLEFSYSPQPVTAHPAALYIGDMLNPDSSGGARGVTVGIDQLAGTIRLDAFGPDTSFSVEDTTATVPATLRAVRENGIYYFYADGQLFWSGSIDFVTEVPVGYGAITEIRDPFPGGAVLVVDDWWWEE